MWEKAPQHLLFRVWLQTHPHLGATKAQRPPQPLWAAPAFKIRSPMSFVCTQKSEGLWYRPNIVPFSLREHRENLLWTNALELENWSPGLEIRVPEAFSAGRGTHLGFLSSSWINSRSNSPGISAAVSSVLVSLSWSLAKKRKRKKKGGMGRRGTSLAHLEFPNWKFQNFSFF